MPVYLSPISRRQFLKCSLATGASLMLGKNLWAGDKPTDPHTWALMADIHIAGDRKKVLRNINMTDNLISAIREIRELATRPSAILVAGDCVCNSGEVADYTTLGELLQPLRSDRIAVHLVLGNHDNRENLYATLPEVKVPPSPLKGRHVAMISSPRANWFLMDSLEKTLVTAGFMGTAQLEWLARTLDANTDKPAIIVAHHDLRDIKDGKTSGLRDKDEFLAVITPRKQVKAYVFGHSHNWQIIEHTSGIHLINLPATAWLFSPTTPSGWILATLQNDGVRLQWNCLDHTHKVHGQVVELKWRPS
ncbi:MAG: metallophosphoesterase [Kiritimatiellae bacterium]|nr:metallophosphoesterase [Kiritimatiellia bacterium]MDD5520689.1 metallophosphoesterase [Kiritimatiellia bacterium]